MGIAKKSDESEESPKTHSSIHECLIDNKDVTIEEKNIQKTIKLNPYPTQKSS